MNEKELPHGCVLAIEVFCVCLTLGVSFRFVSAVSPFFGVSLSLLKKHYITVSCHSALMDCVAAKGIDLFGKQCRVDKKGINLAIGFVILRLLG